MITIEVLVVCVFVLANLKRIFYEHIGCMIYSHQHVNIFAPSNLWVYLPSSIREMFLVRIKITINAIANAVVCSKQRTEFSKDNSKIPRKKIIAVIRQRSSTLVQTPNVYCTLHRNLFLYAYIYLLLSVDYTHLIMLVESCENEY